MRRSQRSRDLNGKLKRIAQLKACLHPLAQGLAIDKFRGDEPRIADGADFMNRENVWMIQSGSRLRFLDESLQSLLIRGEGFRKNFDGDLTIEFSIDSQ